MVLLHVLNEVIDNLVLRRLSADMLSSYNTRKLQHLHKQTGANATHHIRLACPCLSWWHTRMGS